MSAHPTEEPSANDRRLAQVVRGQFVALIQAGFTEAQALNLLGQQLAAAVQANMRKGPDQ